MYYNLCRTYRGPDRSSKEKETSKTSDGVMREHEGKKLTNYNCQHKGD